MFKILFVLFLSVIVVYSVKPLGGKDYYWRYYQNGVVPHDAYDVYYKNIPLTQFHIGTGHVNGEGLLIGEIYSGNQNMLVAAHNGQVHNTNPFIEVLCTEYPSGMKWWNATSTTLKNLPREALVPGGTESRDYNVVYIGRAMVEGVVHVGTIDGSRNYLKNRLRVVHAGKTFNLDEFEVLAYTIQSNV